MKKLWIKLAALVKKRLQESLVAKIALGISVVVVFSTTYALVLPALTISTDSSSSVIQSVSSSEETTTEALQEESSQAESSKVTDSSTTTSEAETESSDPDAVAAGSLSAETSDVTVTATYEDNTFSEPVTLKVSPVSDTSAINDKLTSVLSETKQTLAQAYTYDISFVTASGKEVEPSKDVNVSIAFKNAVLNSELQSGWKLYHFVDNDVNKVEDLTEQTDTTINQDSSNSVISVNFKSDSFSNYTIAGVTYADFSDYLTGYIYDESSAVEDLSTQTLTVNLELDYTISKAHLDADRYYYLELPDDTAIGQDINLNTEYIGKDSNQVDAYTYKFTYDSQTGKYYILIAFIESYVNEIIDGTQSTGWLKYDATYGSTHLQNDGSYSVQYSDSLVVTIPEDVISKNYDLTTSKSGSVTYDGDTPYITYTVRVDSKYGTPSSIDIKDVLTASGVSISALDSVSVTKSTYAGNTGNVTSTEDVSSGTYSYSFNASNKTLNMTLPQLVSGGVDSSGNPIGHYYTVTYRYKVSGLTAGSSVTANNTVTATSQTDEDDKETHSSSSNVTLSLNQVDKQGSYNASDGTITWTIKVNSNHNDIAGALLTDEMFSQASSVNISPNTGATLQYSNGKITGIKFSATSDNKNINEYTITYTTSVDQSSLGWDSSSIKNKVTLDDDGNTTTSDDQVTKETEVTVPGTGSLTKGVSAEGVASFGLSELAWEVELEMPNSGVLKSGTVFTDTLKDPYNQNSEVHWYTKDQLEDLYHRLVEIFGTGRFTLEARQPNYGDYTSYSDLSDTVHYTEFKVTLTADYTSSNNIGIHYRSTIDLDKSSTQKYANTITSGTHNFTKEYDYSENTNVVKMDGNGNSGTTNTTSSDGTVTWMVRVDLDDNATSMTVTDTLPEGVSLTGLTYGQRWGQIAANLDNNILTEGANEWGTYNIKLDGSISSDGVVTLNFTTTDGKTLKDNIGGNTSFWLTFTTHYDDFTVDGAKITKSLTNNVSVTVDGEEYGSDDQTQNVTFDGNSGSNPGTDTKPISKSGEWDNAKRQLSYSLDINPEGADLVEGSDEITLTDTMHNWSNEVSEYLIQDSVKLYYADGTEVPASEWSWKVTSTDDGWGNHYHTLVVTLKDSTPYILEYSYQLTKANEDNAAYYYPHNTATLEGVANGSDSTTTTVHWQRTGTSSGFDTEKAYIISKVDADNFGLALEGATFTVYKYDGDLDDSNDEVIGTPYQTNAKGQISIVYSKGIYQEDIIYYAKETKAPAGYNLPDNPEKHYFYWDEDGSLSTLPIEIQHITNLSENNGSAYVENEKIKTIDLTVNKKWFTATGDETSRSDGSITYDVIQVATAEDGTSTESTHLSGETLSHDDDWTKTYTKLPVSGTDSSGNAVTYTYYVKENAVSGYDTSYTNSNNDVPTEEAADMAIASDSATITIRNTAQKQYDLPETGGNGTQWHYLAGAALSLLAIGLLIFKVYKRYQIGGHL
ncbi:hypothetical protein JG537_08325 [Streptococcus sp. SL1232]|uniref:SpaA isopeptide-forming pilin-related protein n=1 Tax=Streptococcus vicugnae TaxID=2740579 RepID=UPI0018F6C831|nr:SpaA isopeptide-forming pilin-related protein [Streptococcus vicugnae]MBJ7541713.1 hypothetical protein [Streptococcus vicugnae]